MENPGSPADILRRISTIVPITESDAAQLHQLLQGVHAATTTMASLAPVFPDEVDPARLSLTVDGQDAGK
jgi:hypothetical protein